METKVTVPLATLQMIVNYLTARPWGEVHQMISDIQSNAEVVTPAHVEAIAGG